jgi:Uma2 family endonuclease
LRETAMRTRLHLTHADHGRALSWDDFIGADFEEGYRYEMIEGRVFVSPIPNMPHNSYEKWLERTLFAYAQGHPEVLRHVTGPARVFLPDDTEGVTAPEPDLACYDEYASNPYDSDADWRDYSPVLVVEVISPDTADKDLVRNRRLYLQVPSIREYWVLDPRQGVEGLTLLVYRRRSRRWEACRTVAAGGTYTTPLLPGFSLLLDPLAG